MWILLAIVSSICLGFYDIVKKLALEGNNVFHVLFLNTFFCTLFMAPVLVHTLGDMQGNFVHPLSHLYLLIKALIVTASWLLGYFAIKHLPLTIQSSINAVRPILVLVGALIIFGECPGPLQCLGGICVWRDCVARRRFETENHRPMFAHRRRGVYGAG